MIPELANVLASQHRKHYNFGDYPKEYLVFDQCGNIDNTPVHNLQMERQCGEIDYRLKKMANLDAVSRDMINKHSYKL